MTTGPAHGEATIHSGTKGVSQVSGGCPAPKTGSQRLEFNSRLQLAINRGKNMLGFQQTEDNQTEQSEISYPGPQLPSFEDI